MTLKNTGNLFFASIWLIGYFVQNAESFTDFNWVYLPSVPNRRVFGLCPDGQGFFFIKGCPKIYASAGGI